MISIAQSVFNGCWNIETRELFNCLINREEWKSKSPLRKCLYLYGIGKSLYNVIKMTPYKDDQTLCSFSYYPLFYVFVHLFLVVYTTVHYITRGEFNKFLPCTCVFVGPVCGVCNHRSKWSFNRLMNKLDFQILPVVLTKRRYILHDFLAFPGQNLYPDSVHDENKEFYDICSIRRVHW